MNVYSLLPRCFKRFDLLLSGGYDFKSRKIVSKVFAKFLRSLNYFKLNLYKNKLEKN